MLCAQDLKLKKKKQNVNPRLLCLPIFNLINIQFWFDLVTISFIWRQGHHNSLYANSVGPVVEMRQTLRVVTARHLFTSSVVLLRPPYNIVRVTPDLRLDVFIREHEALREHFRDLKKIKWRKNLVKTHKSLNETCETFLIFLIKAQFNTVVLQTFTV